VHSLSNLGCDEKFKQTAG